MCRAFVSPTPPPGHALEQKKCKEQVHPGSNPPPFLPLLSHLKKIFFGVFGVNFLCVPQSHVQGVGELFTLNSMSL